MDAAEKPKTGHNSFRGNTCTPNGTKRQSIFDVLEDRLKTGSTLPSGRSKGNQSRTITAAPSDPQVKKRDYPLNMVGLHPVPLKSELSKPKGASPRTLLELQRRNLENLMKRNTKRSKMNKTCVNGMYFDLDR